MPSNLPSIWSSFELENKTLYENIMGFPCGSAGKESTSNAGDPCLIPGLGRSSGEIQEDPTPVFLGFPSGSAGKESARNEGDLGSIPGLGRTPGEENGYQLQYSGLENSMDYIVHGVTKSWTRLSDFHFTSLLLLQSTGSRHAGLVVAAHRLRHIMEHGIFPDQQLNPCPLHRQVDS